MLGHGDRFCDFQGFTLSEENFQISENRRRISVLAQAARKLLKSSSRSPGVPCLLGSEWPASSQGFQLALNRGWDYKDESVLVPWDPSSQADLLWWCEEGRLEEGVSLVLHFPVLMCWSDASDQGWGASLGSENVSGLWSLEEALLSINARELLALEKGLLAFLPCVQGKSVAIFTDNMTALEFRRRQGGTSSPLFNVIAQRILRWAEVQEIRLFPDMFKGKRMLWRTPFPDLIR